MALRHKVIGKAARLYWRFTRPRTLGVRGLIVDERGRIVLVRHTYSDLWYLPGGGVKKNESVVDALARELREEIALTKIELDRVLGVYHSRREYKDDHIVVFVVYARGSDGVLPVADPAEIADAGWFSISDLPGQVSPATARRITDYREGAFTSGAW